MQPKYKIGSAPRACRSFASTFVASVCPSKRKDLAMCKPMVYQSNIDRHENTSVKQFDYVQLLLCSPNQFYVSRCVGCMTVVQLVCLTRMHTTSSVAESSLWSAHNINCSLLSPTRRNRNWMTVIPYDIWFNLWSSLGRRKRNRSPKKPQLSLTEVSKYQTSKAWHDAAPAHTTQKGNSETHLQCLDDSYIFRLCEIWHPSPPTSVVGSSCRWSHGFLLREWFVGNV